MITPYKTSVVETGIQGSGFRKSIGDSLSSTTRTLNSRQGDDCQESAIPFLLYLSNYLNNTSHQGSIRGAQF